MSKRRNQKRIEYKTGINKIDFQRNKSRALLKEIQNFNSRLKNFLDKKQISKDTYLTLLFNKDKIDYYTSSIFNQKQFNNFVNELKQLNRKTIEMSKKDPRFTQYEIDILKKREKYFEKYADIYHHNYKDIKFNVNKLGRDIYFNKVLATKYVVENRNIRFREAFKKAYRNVFGEDNTQFNKLTDEELSELLTHPNFHIGVMYQTAQDKSMRKNIIDKLIKDKLDDRAKDRKQIKEKKKALKELFDDSKMPYYIGEDIEKIFD